MISIDAVELQRYLDLSGIYSTKLQFLMYFVCMLSIVIPRHRKKPTNAHPKSIRNRRSRVRCARNLVHCIAISFTLVTWKKPQECIKCHEPVWNTVYFTRLIQIWFAINSCIDCFSYRKITINLKIHPIISIKVLSTIWVWIVCKNDIT